MRELREWPSDSDFQQQHIDALEAELASTKEALEQQKANVKHLLDTCVPVAELDEIQHAAWYCENKLRRDAEEALEQVRKEWTGWAHIVFGPEVNARTQSVKEMQQTICAEWDKVGKRAKQAEQELARLRESINALIAVWRESAKDVYADDPAVYDECADDINALMAEEK